MVKLKTMVVSALVAAFGLVAPPASAADCSLGGGDVSAAEACRIAAKYVCGVVAKGQPCLD